MGRTGQGPWPPMVWIGGAPGAGKSTLARALATTQDLPFHPIDLWTYDHLARMPPAGDLDEELAQGPDAAADAFEAASRARLRLVIEDIRARDLGDVPPVVEGPQLTPAAAAGNLPAGWSVWLLPAAGRMRWARQQRLAQEQALAGRANTSRWRTESLLRRDAILARRIRHAAARWGLAVVEVPQEPDWSLIAAAVRAALAPALASAPRLSTAGALRRQRQRENEAASRQGRLWQQAAGLATAPRYSFACECGTSGCQATWLTTPDEYDASPGKPLITHQA